MPPRSRSPVHRTAALFGSLLLLLAAGCAPPEQATEVTLTEGLAFEALGRGQHARLDTTALAIRDAATWATYQDSLRPLQPFTDVDFAQEMVLLAAVPVPTGGYTVAFESAEKQAEGLTVTYVLSTPGADCITTMGQAVVFQAVRLARTDGPVRFVRTTEAYPCSPR